MIAAATKYAVRSLGRNPRRTLLSIVGIGVGCALALSMESMNRGRDELFARAGAYAGAGHVRIVPGQWNARRDVRLRLANWQADLAAATALPGVAAVTTRSRAEALVAMGTHVVPVELTGVNPATEPATNRFVRNMWRGRYLTPDDHGAVVIGKALADRLSADLDDEILATAVGKSGEIDSAMLRIVGITRTGSDELDAAICQTTLKDVATLTGLDTAGEVTLILDNWRDADAVKSTLGARVAAGDDVLTWGEIAPDFKGHMEQDKASSRLVSAIILLIVLLGVASAQLAAVLERRREFAVLSALGMSGANMVTVVVQEALMLGAAGGMVALGIGLPLVWQLARVGLDFRRYVGSAYAFQGVLFDPVIRGDVGMWILPYVFVVAIGATVLASVYPAWYAARTDPAVALRVAQ